MLREITDPKFAITMREIHTAAFGFIIDPYLTPYRLRRMIEGTRHMAFGYFLKDTLAGFLFVDNESTFPGKLIEHFAVLPWHQGNSVGSKLLSYVVNNVDRGSVFFLSVDMNRHWLVDFYKKHGFEKYDDEHLIFTGPNYWPAPTKFIEFEEGDDPSNPSELGHP